MQKVTSGAKLYKQVLDQIERLIVLGVYKKGDYLPSEMTLATEMGVSRITVREALRLLSEAGVIETRRGKGSYVKLDATDLLQSNKAQVDYQQAFLHSTDARILLEPSIARQVAETASDEAITAIRASLHDDRFEESFHRSLVLALNNPILLHWFDELFHSETDTSLSQLTPPTRQKSIFQTLQHQHQQIYDALVQRNGEFAYFYMKEHLMFIRKTYTDFFEMFYGGQ